MIAFGSAHRAEFVDIEKAVAPSDTALAKQHRGAILHQDGKCHHRQQRRQDDHRSTRYRYVEQPLGGAGAQPERPERHAQEPMSPSDPRAMCTQFSH